MTISSLITAPRLALLAAAILIVAWLAQSRRLASAPAPSAPPAQAWNELAAAAVLAIKGGSLQEAYRFHDEARALVTPPQPGDIRPAQTLVLLAEIHQSAEKPVEAEAAYHEAVAAGEAAVGPNNPALLQLLDALANFYYYREQFDPVLPIYERILRITEADPNASPRDVANRARNLAALYEQLDRHAEAGPLYQQALAAGEQAGPVFQSEWIQDMLTVAAFESGQGQDDAAESLAKRALALAEQSAGPDSLDAASALDALAKIYFADGKPDAAEPLATRSLAIAEHSLGPDSADLSSRLEALATIAAAEHNDKVADAHFTRALTLTEAALGPNSPELAALLIRYADLLDTTNRPTEAAARRKQADLIINPPVYEPTLAE